MSYIENIYICLAAPILLAIILLRREARGSLTFTLMGMTSCLLSAYVSSFAAGAAGLGLAEASFEIAPVVEEVMKSLPILFYLLVFAPRKGDAIRGTIMVSVGFATFENVCFLTSYGTEDLLRLLIRGFGTGAMHVTCGMVVAIGLFFLWDRAWLRVVGGFALLCFVIRFHSIYNLLVNGSGPVFWIGSAIPLTFILVYMIAFRSRIRIS
ncbi:MAG: PrsW family intramembrane metalloprotease [Firmicutes bacterium]|nr:PrsW family intramembrane metalloprotease [Bacillota bacterium]